MVESIDFSLPSPEFIKKLAICEVSNPGIYFQGHPRRGGLLDSRFGSLNSFQVCKTCGHNAKNCPGHFGYIEVPKPYLILPSALDTVYKILQSVCYRCSSLLLNGQCPNECSNLPSYSKQNFFIMIVFDEQKKNNDKKAKKATAARVMYPFECLEVIEKISANDLLTLGYDKFRSDPCNAVLASSLSPSYPCETNCQGTQKCKNQGARQPNLTLLRFTKTVHSTLQRRKRKTRKIQRSPNLIV